MGGVAPPSEDDNQTLRAQAWFAQVRKNRIEQTRTIPGGISLVVLIRMPRINSSPTPLKAARGISPRNVDLSALSGRNAGDRGGRLSEHRLGYWHAEGVSNRSLGP